MRFLTALLATLATAAGVVLLVAQTAAPNAAGISMGHIHLVVPDPAAMQKVWVDVMGGTPSTAGPLTLVKLRNVFIIITGGANAAGREGTDGSVVNHVGFSVKSYAATKAKAEAAGLAVRELTPGQQAFVTFPNNVTVEIQEDTAINSEAEFSHFHLSVPDPNAEREWYIKTFGGEEGQRRKGVRGAKIPGGFVDFLGIGGRGGRGQAKGGDGAGTASTGAGRVEGKGAGSHRLRSEGPQGVHRAAGGGRAETGRASHGRNRADGVEDCVHYRSERNLY